MAQTEHVYTRLTHKYRDAWRHLDSEVYVGSIRLTAPKVTQYSEDFDYGNTVVQFGRLPAGCDKREFIRALESTLSNSGCSHEHDCCGCASYYARATVRGRQVRVETSVSFNY